MNAFTAVVRVCADGIAQEACPDAEALEVRVANELGGTSGRQELIARNERRAEIGKSAYLKTECRRVKAAE